MQFDIISPLMLIPLYYSPLWGSIICLALMFANFIAAGVISKHNHLGSNMILGDSSNETFTLIYVKPWCRIAPYVVCIFIGYILYKRDCKVKMSKVVNMLGWATATAFALLVLYGLYDSGGKDKLDGDAVARYNATGRAAWEIAVALVLLLVLLDTESYLFLGNLCFTYAAAFVVSLAFESPMMGLEKVLLGREKRS